MVLINIITTLCLILMTIGVVSVVLNLIIKKRAERIEYVRKFKKGKGVLIYIYAIPLLWTGIVYSGQTVFYGFFSAVRRIFDLIVLKYDISPVQMLVEANPLYSFTMYFCFILVGLNAIMFTLSLASQYIWNFFTNLNFIFSQKEKLIIFGNNEQNALIYKSEKNRVKILADKINDKECESLYMRNISYSQVVSFKNYVFKKIKACARSNKNYIIVINTGNDEKNISLGNIFVEGLTALEDIKREACFGKLKIFLFGDPQYEAIYEDIIDSSYGCISYINKYQRMAMDFIDNYPLTRFMTGEHIDYKTSFIKKDVDINVLMIGFGKTNQQIFLTSVANNQFIMQGKDSVELKKVNYHIFDKRHAENNKNLNHNYYRYKNECKDVAQSDYLPLPSYPAEEFYHHLDINDVEFYNNIKEVLMHSEKDANYIIIAFGTDLENIDMAKKLIEKSQEWGVKNLNTFVKVRNEQKCKFTEGSNCYIIANESTAVYDINSIVGDKIFKMAQLRDEVYAIEYDITQNGGKELSKERIDEIKTQAYRNWYIKRTQMERDSNLYCCLSLRMKLNLMGLDYCPKNDENQVGLTEQEYLTVYANADMPDTNYYEVTAEGKPIVHYTLNYPNSRRKNMAVHEHLRWNSFMISKGTIPATKQQIKNETIMTNGRACNTNGKNYKLRRHGNLTTFEGLEEFRRIIAERDKTAEEKKDVIKYDYQLLDDAYWLLTATKQKIVKKANNL